MKHGHVNPRHLGRLKSGESAVGAELETEGILFSGKATILNMELSDLTTVKPFVPSFLDLKLPLHYLICNSNIMAPTEWLPSKKNFELQFATNNLSHFPLTELLLPKLQETMRSWEVQVVILTSVAGACCFDLDPQKLPCPIAEYHDAVEYAVSKAVDCLTCPPVAEKELFAEKSGVHYSEHLGTCFQSE